MPDTTPLFNQNAISQFLSDILSDIQSVRQISMTEALERLSKEVDKEMIPIFGEKYAHLWSPYTLRGYISSRRVERPIPLQNLNAIIVSYDRLIKDVSRDNEIDYEIVTFLYRANGVSIGEEDLVDMLQHGRIRLRLDAI